MKTQIDKAIAMLETSDRALVGGDFAVVYRNDRWHLLTLTYFGALLGVHTVHFMSRARALERIAEWLPGSRVLAFCEISEILPDEIERKLFASAEDYLPLLRDNLVDIGAGFTTDTVEFFAYHPSKEQAFLNILSHMIDTGEPGAYLRFHRTSRHFPV